MTNALYGFVEGPTPLLISSPHSGTSIPAEIAPKLTELGRTLVDTDWQVDTLYAPIAERLGASMICAKMTRYAADLNRSAADQSLYAERKVSRVVSLESFDGEALYLDGAAPDEAEIARRIEAYWRPYHDKLRSTLDAIRARHGYALLWDAHSIREHVPALAAQGFPVLNIGTADGVSCDPSLQTGVHSVAAQQEHYSFVLNGFFKGGYITRNYGAPNNRISAVQLELRQDSYLDPAFENALSDKSADAMRDLILRMMTAFCGRAAEIWG